MLGFFPCLPFHDCFSSSFGCARFFLVITQRFSPLPLKYIGPCLSWGIVEEDGEFEPSLVVVQVLQQETIRMFTVAWQPYTKTVHLSQRGGPALIYLPSHLFFLHSFLLFFTQNKEGDGPSGPSPRSATANNSRTFCTITRNFICYKIR